MKETGKQNKGITMIALAITITVLLILAGVAFYSGKDTIKRAQLEEVRTNMLLIQAKARECVEEVNFQLGPKQEKKDQISTIRKNVYEAESLKPIGTETGITIPAEIPKDDTVYVLTQETFKKWGLDKIKLQEQENYLVQFDETKAEVEVYNTRGYEGHYSLTQLDEL